MYPQTEDGRSGWQGCNLTEINGSMCNTKEDFLRACKASAILGTIQAAYTDFTYVGPESKEIFEREALLGCSVTGWMNNPKILFDEVTQREGATLILEINAIVADIIGINYAARATCTKPSGNSSVILMTSSGIHGEHDDLYFRVMQLNKGEEIAKYLNENYPNLLEESVWSENNTDYGGTAVARGRGENIGALPNGPPFWMVVVKPEEGVSTAWAYQALDAVPERASHRATKRMEEALRNGDNERVIAGQSNDFELPVFEHLPKIAWLHDELLMAGARSAHLCGSGSAVYGIADEEAAAERIAKHFRSRYPHVAVARTATRAEAGLIGGPSTLDGNK